MLEESGRRPFEKFLFGRNNGIEVNKVIREPGNVLQILGPKPTLIDQGSETDQEGISGYA